MHFINLIAHINFIVWFYRCLIKIYLFHAFLLGDCWKKRNGLKFMQFSMENHVTIHLNNKLQNNQMRSIFKCYTINSSITFSTSTSFVYIYSIQMKERSKIALPSVIRLVCIVALLNVVPVFLSQSVRNFCTFLLREF